MKAIRDGDRKPNNHVTPSKGTNTTHALMPSLQVNKTIIKFKDILVPRGRDPSGLRQESRPLAASKTASPRFMDSLSNMTNLIGRKHRTSTLRILRHWEWSEVSIPVVDVKDRGLWGREWFKKCCGKELNSAPLLE